MPHFIIATDFSPVAENATRYACAMAEALHASVTVVHTYMIPVAFGMDTPMPVMPIDEARDIAEQRIRELVAHLRLAHPAISISSDVVYGEAIDALSDYLERAQADLIFLGNSGTGNTDLWMGSTVVSALRRLPHTIVAIPKEAVYRPVLALGFACDYEHLNESLPKAALQQLLQLTQARLHIVSVFKSVAEAAGKTDPALLSESLGISQPIFHSVVSEKVDDGIQQFAVEHQIDWLAVVPQKHSFFEGIFHRSHTKAMVRMSHIPLVALHKKA